MSLLSLSCFKLAQPQIQNLDNQLPDTLDQEFMLGHIVPLANKLAEEGDFDSAAAVLVMGVTRYNGPDETRREALAAIAAVKLNHAQAMMDRFQKEGAEIQTFLQVTSEEKQAISEIMETALALQADGLRPVLYTGA